MADSVELNITFRDIPEFLHQELSAEFEKLANRHLDRHITHFAPDSVRLRIVAEENKHHANLRTVGLRLNVPGSQLASEETTESIQAAARSAFAELERQLIQHVEKLRGENQWTRRKQRAKLRRLRAAVAERSAEERETFIRAIQPLMPKLRRFARFERKHLWARGELKSDYPSVDDLIDEVLARAARDPDLLKPPTKVLSKLYRIMIDVASEVSRRERKRSRLLSLEIKPPREPTDREIDETFYDFFQPDEVIRLEDLASDPSTEPEELVGRKEMQQVIASLLASMPAKWRRAVILSHIESMGLSTVASVLKATEAEVREWLDRADDFLRARLHDEGIKASDTAQLSYLAPSDDLDIGSDIDEILENESQ